MVTPARGSWIGPQQSSPAIIRTWYVEVVTLLFLLLSIQSASTKAQTTPDSVNPVVTTVSDSPEVDAVIAVSVLNLEKWSAIKGNDPWKLVPYMNDLALKGNYPLGVNLSRGRLVYHLQITDKNKQEWIDLLGPLALNRPVTLTVGLEKGVPFTSMLDEQHPVTLIVVEKQWAIITIGLIITITALCVWLTVTTDIFREDESREMVRGRKKFSLAKIQMGFWFLVIFDSFLGIWVATGETNSLNPSVLVLLGISAGTALGDLLISQSKSVSPNLPVSSEANPGQVAEVPSAPVPASPDAAFDSPSPQPAAVKPSQTIGRGIYPFLRDLLSDEHGVSFHRLQMLAWTIVLGLVFISDVYYDLTMPDLNSNLLALMGLSSGTYLSFRVPEARQPSSSSPQAT
jgi:hypothetical protein